MTGLIQIIIAVVVASLLGIGVQRFLDYATKSIDIFPPDGIDLETWEKTLKIKKTGAIWIGFFERILIIAALWLNSPSIIVGWLVFKVAAKWEVWKNIIKIPDSLENTTDISYLGARNAWGTWIFNRFLLGTLVNIFIGLLAYYIGHNSKDIIECYIRSLNTCRILFTVD